MKPVNWNDPDLVGKKITRNNGRTYFEVLCNGNYMVFLRAFDDRGVCHEGNYNKYTHDWYYYEEPEEEECCTWPGCENHVLKGPVPEGKETASGLRDKKLLAPALCKIGKTFFTTDNVFESEQEAKDKTGRWLVKWPAIPNKDGFYEVSDE